MEPTKQQIQAAAKCTTVKEALELLFPDAFKEKLEYFDFGSNFNILPVRDNTTPLFIGRGLAPEELRNKCLILNYGWDFEVIEYDSRKVIRFFKKLT